MRTACLTPEACVTPSYTLLQAGTDTKAHITPKLGCRSRHKRFRDGFLSSSGGGLVQGEMNSRGSPNIRVASGRKLLDVFWRIEGEKSFRNARGFISALHA